MPSAWDFAGDVAIKCVATYFSGGTAPAGDILRRTLNLDEGREDHLRIVSEREKDVERLTDYRAHLKKLGVESEPVLITASLYGKMQNALARSYSGAARGANDFFQLGDVMRDPSLMNLLKDVGRASIIAEGANGVLQSAQVLPRIIRGGGPMSCVDNAAANVGNESGQILVGLDNVAAARNTSLGAILSPSYQGVSKLRVIGDMFRQLGVKFERFATKSGPGVPATQSLDDLTAKSMQFKDPIAFGIMWKGLDRGSHAMSVINRGGLIYYVDQVGEFLLKGNGVQKFLECVRPFQATARGLRYAAENMDYIIPYAYRAFKVHPPVVTLGPATAAYDFLNLQIPVQVVNLQSLVMTALDMTRPGPKKEITRHKPEPPKQPADANGRTVKPPRLHTIQRGDTLFGLAKLQYGDAAEFKRIVEVNPFLTGTKPHQQLPIGTMILLP